MLLKTHLAITLFFILLFLPSVNNKIIFVLVAIIATYLPDVDSRHSTIGRRKLARVLQWFTKHRGMMHSFTFLLSITVVLVFVWPKIALGFFTGYGLHLFADSFTKNGIRSFYPSKKVSKGPLKTGSFFETGIVVAFVFADLFLLVIRIGVL